MRRYLQTRGSENHIFATEAPSRILADTAAVLAREEGVEVDYVALADPDTFDPVGDGAPGGARAFLLVAARVGATRLIDNTLLTLGGGSSQGGE